MTSLEKIEKLDGLIDIASENNVDFEYINTSSNNLNTTVLSTLADFNNHIISMQTLTQDNSYGSIGFDSQSRHVSTKTIAITSLNNLAIEVVTNPLPNFSLVPGDSTSFLSNTVIGNTWVQNSMNISNMNYSSTEAQVTLLGFINSGITWENFHIGIKVRRGIKFLINKNNGQIGSSYVYTIN